MERRWMRAGAFDNRRAVARTRQGRQRHFRFPRHSSFPGFIEGPLKVRGEDGSKNGRNREANQYPFHRNPGGTRGCKVLLRTLRDRVGDRRQAQTM